MRLNARSVRGGPVPVRIALALFVLSAALLLSFGTATSVQHEAMHPALDVADAESGPLYETASAGSSRALPTLPSQSSSDSNAQPSSWPTTRDRPVASDPLREHGGYTAPVELAAAESEDLESAAGMLLGLESPAEEPAPIVFEESFEGELKAGQTLSASLEAQGVPAATVHVIAREIRPLFNFRNAQPGHRFQLLTDEDEVLEFRYRLGRDESIRLWRDAEGAYLVAREESQLVPQVVRMAGIVETSLYEAIESLGEDPSLATDFAQVFAWEIDFNRSVHPGDEFGILYERMFRREADGTEEYVRPGRILAARYRSGEREYEAMHFDAGEGRGGYYRPDGTSVERQFLTAPLQYSRISSGYTGARRHPILKITRAHYGIDYAAASGTPVWSVADGTVIFRGRAGGFGNLVKVRHANGYVSYYAHLSAFANGLHVGQHIAQKQQIGRVGSTGLATGPHVCFRIAKDGRYVDPRRINSPAAEPIPEKSWQHFASARDQLMARLDGRDLGLIAEAL